MLKFTERGIDVYRLGRNLVEILSDYWPALEEQAKCAGGKIVHLDITVYKCKLDTDITEHERVKIIASYEEI